MIRAEEISAEEIYTKLVTEQNLKDSYYRWSDYRKKITDFIIKNTESGKSIAIIGVGESNDIDLARLYNHMGNLTLYDIDMDSVSRALDRYSLKDKTDIVCRKIDLFGATKDEYIHLIDLCWKDVIKEKNRIEIGLRILVHITI